MLHIHGGSLEHGAADFHEERGRSSRSKLSPPLQIPRNRSTGSLAQPQENPDRSRIRFSYDAASADHDAAAARPPIMTDHDHGLGMSGLRRIRQLNPPRTPTLPSQPASRSSSLGLTRSSSMTMMLDTRTNTTLPMTPGPSSPIFTEDLSRFPSESLHSFSFAHQSEELIHNRQNVLKRSMDFLKDRLGMSGPGPNAALASAQARATGDVEMQDVLDLLARAQVVEAGNLPHHPDSNLAQGPLTGPAYSSAGNVFDRDFIPRTASPEPVDESAASSAVDADPVGSSIPSTIVSPSSPDRHSPDRRSPPPSRQPAGLRRTLTDTEHVLMQQKLIETMAKPFLAGNLVQAPAQPPQPASRSFSTSLNGPNASSLHGHSTRWVPAAQAIFTTEAKPPWTILAANDLACLVFGVTKAEVRKIGILEVVQEERRDWLQKKLQGVEAAAATTTTTTTTAPPQPPVQASKLLGGRAGGITSRLLSKPNSRSVSQMNKTSPADRRATTVHAGDPKPPRTSSNHKHSSSRGVLLCGDVVPIRKRNGATGSASLWVKEKRVGLIWVLEEIHEDTAHVTLGEDGLVTKLEGALAPIWGDAATDGRLRPGIDIGVLVPRIPRQGIDPRFGDVDFAQVARTKYFTCRNSGRINIPATVEQVRGRTELRISSFPHIAGIVVVGTGDLTIKSSNSAFSGALFGYENPDGLPVNQLIPDFDKVLRILTDDDGVELADGIVVPEHSFRRAAALLHIKEGRAGAGADSTAAAAAGFLRPDGLPARHRDGSELKIDVQMRVVQSEKQTVLHEETVVEASEDEETGAATTTAAPSSAGDSFTVSSSEMVYALWITYSRHLHATRDDVNKNDVYPASPLLSGAATPMHQPSPGQTPAHTPQDMSSDSEGGKKEKEGKKEKKENKKENKKGEDKGGGEKEQHSAAASPSLTKQLKEAAMTAAARITGSPKQPEASTTTTSTTTTKETPASPATTATPVSRRKKQPSKKTTDDFVVLEEMGQGAYGQVKLARYKGSGKKCVLKYVTKRRILVDTWTRDRRLGTVPLEIHVLDYLRRDGLRHPNIVEMEDFFEDDVNYYIEMVPHGLPGMDLFDYIELRANMEERECRSIFVQVARAIRHLHAEARVVHRDIKDENVILDGDGNIKLIDFGSAAYLKSGPFDVFVGTIDYAAPEVLAGKPYGGKEQDVWALGILLYTIIYKENPFYSIDEIMDRDLRVPYTISDESIDLVRCMLNRDVEQRYDIEQVLQHPWCQVQG